LVCVFCAGVLSFEEWLRGCVSGYVKRKKPMRQHVRSWSCARLESWSYSQCAADPSVAPQPSSFEEDSADLPGQRSSPFHDKPHMRGEDMNIACGPPRGNGLDSGAEKDDAEELAGVATKSGNNNRVEEHEVMHNNR